MQKNQIISYFFVALLSAGCAKTTSNVVTNPENQASKDLIKQTCVFDKAVCDYYLAQTDILTKPMTMTISYESTNPTLKNSKTISQNDGKGNMHTVTTDNKNTTEMIVLGTVSYLKDNSDGKWLKITSEADAVNPESIVTKVDEQIKEIGSDTESEGKKMKAIRVGSEACGSATCDIYDMFQEGAESEKSTTWINTKSHLATKMIMFDKDGTKTIITYDYNPVVISEPSPIKELKIPKINPKSLQNGKEPDYGAIEDMMKTLPTDLGGGELPAEPQN